MNKWLHGTYEYELYIHNICMVSSGYPVRRIHEFFLTKINLNFENIAVKHKFIYTWFANLWTHLFKRLSKMIQSKMPLIYSAKIFIDFFFRTQIIHNSSDTLKKIEPNSLFRQVEWMFQNGRREWGRTWSLFSWD